VPGPEPSPPIPKLLAVFPKKSTSVSRFTPLIRSATFRRFDAGSPENPCLKHIQFVDEGKSADAQIVDLLRNMLRGSPAGRMVEILRKIQINV